MREAAWLSLYENHSDNFVGRDLRAFVEPAFHEPRLRELRPYTSHSILHFSSTDKPPFTNDHPVVRPMETRDRFTVRTRDGREHKDLDGPEALRIVLADLPDPD